MGTPAALAAVILLMAESCGYPTPACTRVVQIEPGPMPTFTASAPQSKGAAQLVAILPTITSNLGCFALISFNTLAT